MQKSCILDMVVTPEQGTQNVHVRNTWRHRLQDKHRVHGEYESRMGTKGQDVHGGYVRNVLDHAVVRDIQTERGDQRERGGGVSSQQTGRRGVARGVFEYGSEKDFQHTNPESIILWQWAFSSDVQTV